MSKQDNLKDYLADLYQGIASKKPGASKNPQDFRSEIESIVTGEGTVVECSEKHIIEVEELPAVGEDGAIYVTPAIVDLVTKADDWTISFVELFTSMGTPVYFHIISTRPDPSDESIEHSSDLEAHIYYIVDENKASMSGLNDEGVYAWNDLSGDEGCKSITDPSLINENGTYIVIVIRYYQYIESIWNELLTPSGTFTTSTSGIFDIKRYEKLEVKLEHEAFLEDTWTLGTAEATFDGVSTTFTYYYRLNNTDPKTIPFVRSAYDELRDRTYTSSNLADFYFYTLVASTSTQGWHDHWWEFNEYILTEEEQELVTPHRNPVFIASGYGIQMITGDVMNGRSIAVYTGTNNGNFNIVQWNCPWSSPMHVSMCAALPYKTGGTITENGTHVVVNDYSVTVDVPDSPLVPEVSTETEMTSILQNGEIASVIKYTGTTTDTYENGALYLLEEVSE